MNIEIMPVTEPTSMLVNTLNRWGNDVNLKSLSQPNPSKEELEREKVLTIEDVHRRLKYQHLFLIYLENQLIGEMSYTVDPEHLFRKETGTAWISISIGEPECRGKGIGFIALAYLEEQVRKRGLQRIELGVFEFNTPALKLYKKLGYQEIGRIENFTYYDGKMRADIRMEKRM
ncbi:N-acetyltransferase [Sporosarcina sp. P21c]|uniref:GNAT family N-acetyltransferase n=1 Tax=Sporosarcina TaxID=1569 RepID=UPI000A15ACD2|nr:MULTISPECIES: GNAT family N-acetyltransferase [Sporosarcina]ARJ37499.1 GNAT family N-acetyltransferase [Sporosarcina ureae]PIC65955.1 N-acetyltransferase [Sporosarcina sp. P16a]PIC81874.1 N-acetyltransferase [Sporosarcina sp. P1]PIC88291.1 N-acetyltransferase [Sporosarcina sp. P21c]PIC91471.1 N-acetyltransferase [Sporosarcina sp. P25]